MNIRQLITLCSLYAKEGTSVQDQMDDVILGDVEYISTNALKVIAKFFDKAAKYDVEGAEGMAEYARECIEDKQ